MAYSSLNEVAVSFDAPEDDCPAALRSPALPSPSIPQQVSAILRHQGLETGPSSSPADVLDRAAVGAAISILGACLADEAIGPLPRLTTGLLEIVLATDPAAE